MLETREASHLSQQRQRSADRHSGEPWGGGGNLWERTTQQGPWLSGFLKSEMRRLLCLTICGLPFHHHHHHRDWASLPLGLPIRQNARPTTLPKVPKSAFQQYFLRQAGRQALITAHTSLSRLGRETLKSLLNPDLTNPKALKFDEDKSTHVGLLQKSHTWYVTV